MVRSIKLVLPLRTGSKVNLAGRAWNSMCVAVLGGKFIANHCTIKPITYKKRVRNNEVVHATCFATGEAYLSYQDLEVQYDDVDWLLVDCGSSIHICRDKDKLYNLRKQITTIKGIVGDATSVSEWVGDWDLLLRDDSGQFKKFTLRNVVHMPNASRDIMGTPKLEKAGWWPDLKARQMYNDKPHLQSTKFPFLVIKKRLKVIPGRIIITTLDGERY